MLSSIVVDNQSIFTVGRDAPANFKTQQLERTVIPPITCGASFPEPVMTLKPIVTATTTSPSVASSTDQARCNAAENFSLTNQRAKLHMQTKQIDGAIHLLRMQYEAIMCNVRNNQEPANFQSNIQDRCPSQVDLPRPDWTLSRMGQSLQGGQYDCGSAHRKRAAEDVLSDDSNRKRTLSISGKLVLDSEVPFAVSIVLWR